MLLTEVTQKIQLVEGEFTASEASDIVSSLIDEKINFHKLQRLSLCEGNQNANCSYPNARIKELINEKKIAKEFLKEARREGKKVRIDGILNISFED